MVKRLPKSFHCPTEFTLAILGGKWKTVILCFLKERPCRYSELRKLTWGAVDLSRSVLVIGMGKARRLDEIPIHPDLAAE